MKQKTHDTETPGQGRPETSGDGVLKDLAAKAAALAPVLATEASGDPRRRGEIRVEGEKDDDTIELYIDGEMWAEIDYSWDRGMWCIQDCMGQCLTHIEHMHFEVPNNDPNGELDATAAIEKA